jgi:GNAT superfamily N-acetyltransferase
LFPIPAAYEFEQSTGRIDRARVHAWLSHEAYWALGRPREVQDAAIDGSRNYGIYRKDTGGQVAYARVITDGVTFAWLCDVFVAGPARGEGIGKALIAGVAADLDRLNLKRTVLVTGDAHELYGRFGFEALAAPQRWMAREAPPSS